MLLVNGTVVTEKGTHKMDLRIVGETIDEMDTHLEPIPGEEVVDASGLLVLPGGVDVHTHMDLDLGTVRATDDFYTGTVAAACGGTTTIVDHMAFGPKGCSISHQIDAYHKLADGKAVIDYGFHGVMDHVDDAILEELEVLAKQGVTSHKFYLTYGGKLSDNQVIMLMERAKELGILLTVHPENDGVVNYYREKYSREGKTQPIYHAKSRPIECEAEAIGRMVLFAGMAGDAPLYIVHLSNGMGLDIVNAARKAGQKNLFVETCPQYLLLEENCYLRPDALKYIMAPPLRPAAEQKKLWQGLARGGIDTVATDHCPFFYEKEKQLGKQDFTKAPGGAPGVELRMALLYSFGVDIGRLSLEQYVQVCSTKPAKLFGLYPRKGVLAVGSDGDILLLDPNKQVTISHKLLHENTDYTPYEGMTVTGWPVMTIARGKIVAKNGRFCGEKGYGRYLRRSMPLLDR